MQHATKPSALVEALLVHIGVRFIVRPSESQQFFGWSKSTSHNMVRRGDLPPLRHFGGDLTGWLTSDLIDKFASAPPSRLSGPRSPGRPKRRAQAGAA